MLRPLALLSLCLFLFVPEVCLGIIAFGPDLELEGFVQAQNILRTPRFRGAELIMQRNTAQLEGKWYFLRESRAFGRLRTGPLEEATLTVIARGAYDSIYDIRESFRDRFTTKERENRKFEYKLRRSMLI